jgi:hypothetical protein
MAFPRARFYYHEYKTVGSFLNFSKTIDANASQTLLIFPSHSRHHAKNATLYSQKAGVGRVNLTHAKADLKIPTLGLPIAGIAHVPSKDEMPLLAKNAVRDLWKAAGYGLNFVLPIHRQLNKTYFSQGLQKFPDYEPEFWGFNHEEANPHLAAYYLEELERLAQYLNAPLTNKPPVPGHLWAAFQEGLQAKQASITPPWYSTNPKVWQLYKTPQTLPLEREEIQESAEQKQEEEASPSLSPPSTTRQTQLSSSRHDSPMSSANPHSHSLGKAGKHSTQSPSRPSYEAQYQLQEKNRRWKTAVAITVGLVTLPTIIFPLLSYFFWKRAKENELIQKFEMTPQQFADIKTTRQALRPIDFKQDNAQKPHKEGPKPTADKEVIYYLDKEQAKRLRFFAGREKTKALTPKELARLKQSKDESIKLKPRLGY